MAWEWDDRAEFIEPCKLAKLLEGEFKRIRAADPDLYAGLINELCRAAGWNVLTLIKQTRTRLPGYACGTYKDDWHKAVYAPLSNTAIERLNAIAAM